MESGKSAQLPAYPVGQRLQIDGVTIVLLNVPREQSYPQNIFGIDEKGAVLWQVEPRPSKTPNNQYTSMRDEAGIIVAQTEDAAQRKIDARSGKVLTEETIAE